jgi:hypothetical protein
MNREDIIRMAQAAGLGNGINILGIEGFLERFFHMAQAAEREACLQIVDDFVDVPYLDPTVKAIRARGQA